MKRLTLTLMAFLLAFTVNAQTKPAYFDAIKKGLAQMQQDSTSDQYLASSNYFGRIARAEPKEWLAQYYTAYTTMLIAVLGKQTGDQKDAIYDKAHNCAEVADKLKPENSEVAVVMGYIIFMKMAVDPPSRSMTMITQANQYLDKAATLNPQNPRAYFVKGQDTFYTPEAFGGGPGAAKSLLQLAKQNYDKENMNGIEPGWGKSRCEMLLAQCK